MVLKRLGKKKSFKLASGARVSSAGLSFYVPGDLDIFTLNQDSVAIDGTKVQIFKDMDHIHFGCPLQS